MMISFNSQNIKLPPLDYEKVNGWIEKVAGKHNCNIGRLNYLFCNDDYIIDANRKFLGHDYYTDIITFDYTCNNRISGDMIISVDTVKSNAKLLNLPFEQELLRVIIHGVLHLCGINDKGPGEREIMEQNENMALKLWPTF